MKRLICTFLLSAALGGAYAQTLKVPAASSATTITQGIGIKEVQLKYNRPDMNGRKVFGGLVPFGQVWRLGANGIPVITFEEKVVIDGNNVEAGTYGMFAIPEKDKWTIILSKKSNQWGSYAYTEADDYLRIITKPVALTTPVETYTMSFDNVTTSSAVLNIAWEQTAVKLTIKVDQRAEIMASIDSAMATDKKPYMQAAQYYYDNNLDMKKALAWVTEADQKQAVFYIRYWKAKIQLKTGDKAGAVATAKDALKLAQEAKVQEYINLNNALIAEASKK